MQKTHVGVGANNHSPLRTTIYRSILYVCIGLIAGITIHTVSAWVEPDQMPPGGNIAAPLNTGNVGQSKAGGLVLNSGGATLGLLVERGNVVIGTNDPAMNSDLTVHGNIYGRNMNLNNNLNVGGDTNIGGNLTVNGNTNLHNTYVDGNLNVNGDIHDKNIYGDSFIVNNSNVSVGPNGLCNGTDCSNFSNGSGGCPSGYMSIADKSDQAITYNCVSKNAQLCNENGQIFAARFCDGSPGYAIVKGTLKYTDGIKYTRMQVGGWQPCDTGFQKGEFAQCWGNQSMNSVKWITMEDTPGFMIQWSNRAGDGAETNYTHNPDNLFQQAYQMRMGIMLDMKNNQSALDLKKWDYNEAPRYPAELQRIIDREAAEAATAAYGASSYSWTW